MERYIHPHVEREKMNQIFTSISMVYKKYVTIYVYNTGNFPIRSKDGYIAIFILYDWTKNAILATPIKDNKDKTMINAFQTHIKYITRRGFKPCFDIIVNMAPKPIKVYLKEEITRTILVEANNHQVNAADSAIQTFKNHSILD